MNWTTAVILDQATGRGHRLSAAPALYSLDGIVMRKAAVFIIVLALGGPSAGVLQCELACAMPPSAAVPVAHCHGASGDGPQVANSGHACDHDAGTLASTSSEPVQKNVVPVAATIASTLGTHFSQIVLEAFGGLSPPGAIVVAPSSRPLPLRI